MCVPSLPESPEGKPVSARSEVERIAIAGAGKGLYHWGDDEPTAATGYIAVSESTDAAMGVLSALSEAGYTVARLEEARHIRFKTGAGWQLGTPITSEGTLYRIAASPVAPPVSREAQ